MNNPITKKEWIERVKNNDYTHEEWNMYCLYQYVDYSGIPLKQALSMQ